MISAGHFRRVRGSHETKMKSDHVKAFIFFRATIRLYLEMYYEIARAVLPSTRPDKRTPGVRDNAD